MCCAVNVIKTWAGQAEISRVLSCVSKFPSDAKKQGALRPTFNLPFEQRIKIMTPTVNFSKLFKGKSLFYYNSLSDVIISLIPCTAVVCMKVIIRINFEVITVNFDIQIK